MSVDAHGYGGGTLKLGRDEALSILSRIATEENKSRQLESDNAALRARVEKLEKHSIEWIPVTERLPEKDGYVLTHSRGGSIRTECFFSDPCWHSQKTFGARRGMAEAYGEASVHFAHALEYGYAITHWAAYPNPPDAALAECEEVGNG